ncbi:MAG TPA: FAD-dependent oxidoreductase [Azonexus sp.]|nr:FAD-dependent oxidoreductase [Azonexus sp.]
MGLHHVSLAGREVIAEGSMAFHIAKPEAFSFKPGQAIDLILPGLAESDALNSRHAFSLVSAPCEDRLTIATRMRDSPYKRALGALADGAPLQIDGPFGSLTLHNKRARPAVFIAGGIGITPFVSILRQAAKDRLAQRFVLLYSNRRPQDAAFLGELQSLQAQMEDFRLVATMTEAGPALESWTGATGMIDAQLLRREMADLASPIYYLAGPPVMVTAMRELLNSIGVDDDDIRSEDFYGY